VKRIYYFAILAIIHSFILDLFGLPIPPVVDVTVTGRSSVKSY